MQSEELDFQVTRPYVPVSVVLTSLCAEYCFEMALDFNGDVNNHNVQHVMEELKKTTSNMLVLDQREVPWFPVHISELDGIANRTLDLGTDLSADHPGAHDAEYRKDPVAARQVNVGHAVERRGELLIDLDVHGMITQRHLILWLGPALLSTVVAYH